MKERSRKITIKDIARAAGVSTALVSFAINNKRFQNKVYRINDETSQRILDIAKKLNYKPNNAARSLRSGKSNAIGVIVSDIATPFYANISRYIENIAYKKNFTVLFGSTDENPQKLKKLIATFIDKGVDGLIVVPCKDSKYCINEIVNKNTPLVLLDRVIPDLKISSVTLNNKNSSYNLTKTLINQNAKKIEMISYIMDLSNIKEREDGYKCCMKKFGLEKFINIHYIEYDNMNKIKEIVTSAKKNKVDAFLFATYTLATKGITEIIAAGMNIPNDLKVACFDSNEAFDIFNLPVIYACQPIERFANEAFKLLVKNIDDIEEISNIVLPSNIKIVKANK